MKYVDYMDKYTIINGFVSSGQFVLSVILLSYILFLIHSFAVTNVYQKRPDNKGYFDFKPLTGIVYSVVSFSLIILLIYEFRVLGLFAISYIDNQNTFFAAANDGGVVENNVIFAMVVFPTFLTLFSVIANFSRATYIIHEIDSGVLQRSNGNKYHKYSEGVLRLIIIVLFLFLEYHVKLLSDANVKQVPFSINAIFRNPFINQVQNSFYESLFCIGIFLILLYSLLMLWLYMNKDNLINVNVTRQCHFYLYGIIISLFLSMIAFSVNISNVMTIIVILLFGIITIIVSVLMMRFIVSDVYEKYLKCCKKYKRWKSAMISA